jgi:hypothetical protein
MIEGPPLTEFFTKVLSRQSFVGGVTAELKVQGGVSMQEVDTARGDPAATASRLQAAILLSLEPTHLELSD